MDNFSSGSDPTHFHTRAKGWAVLAQPASHPRAHKSSKDPPRLHYEPGITFSSSWQHRPPPRAENIAIIFFRFFGHVQMYQMCLCPKFELNRSNNAISSARPAFYSEVGNWYLGYPGVVLGSTLCVKHVFEVLSCTWDLQVVENNIFRC